MRWTLVGAAPAAEVEEAAAVEEAEAVELAVPEEAEALELELVVASEGSRVPHFFWMLSVQFCCPDWLPTLAEMHSLKASLQTNCNAQD